MNESNLWETQLRSWPPRRPAARLKTRLFGEVTRPQSVFAGAAFWWRLTPVLGCLLLTLMVFRADHQPTSLTANTNANSLLATLPWTEQFALIGAEAGFNRNLWQMTFESTKVSPFNSTMPSFRLVRTNS